MRRSGQAPLKTVWFLVAAALWLLFWGINRVLQTIEWGRLYQSLDLAVSPAYLIITGIVSGLLGLLSLLMMLRNRRLGAAFAFGSLLLWLLWSWVDVFLPHTNALWQGNWPYKALATLIVTGLSLWQIRKLRNYEHELNEPGNGSQIHRQGPEESRE